MVGVLQTEEQGGKNDAETRNDEHWKKRNILPHLKNIKHAVMVVGGWYDAEDLYGSFKTYQTIEKQNPGIDNIFVVGPWVHGGWAGPSGESLGDINFKLILKISG